MFTTTKDISKISRSSFYDNEDISSNSLEEKEPRKKGLVGNLKLKYKPWHCNNRKLSNKQMYIPLHMHIESLNYNSLIRVFSKAGTGYLQEDILDESPSSFDLIQPLTLMRTQY